MLTTAREAEASLDEHSDFGPAVKLGLRLATITGVKPDNEAPHDDWHIVDISV
jgi:hypothetical protein